MRTMRSQKSKMRIVHFAPEDNEEERLKCLIVKQIQTTNHVRSHPQLAVVSPWLTSSITIYN